MSVNKKGTVWCCVCQMSYPTEAEYALHEFGKKHCDNLIKIAKHKPVVRPKPPSAKKETSTTPDVVQSSSQVAGTGVITKYGYFVPGEPTTTDASYAAREYNYNYDPYLQKLAENPFKEPPKPVIPTTNITCFSKNKKKKMRLCQICNVTLMTIPEYDSHMRSAPHIWKLKQSGTGVSAHFVKASTDLHTTDDKEESSSEVTQSENVGAPSATVSAPFPSLFCDMCELLLNSEQQFTAHMAGKAHKDTIKKKEDATNKKLKVATPVPNQLYCYSCKLNLNNILQFNEHKNGKKHNIQCRKLMREGYTIPPEERNSSLSIPKALLVKAPVYPEMYEKFVVQKKKEKEVPMEAAALTEEEKVAEAPVMKVAANPMSGMYDCEVCGLQFNTQHKYSMHMKGQQHIPNQANLYECKACAKEFLTSAELIVHLSSNNHVPGNCEKGSQQKSFDMTKVKESVSLEIQPEPEENICSVCSNSYKRYQEIRTHLSTEDHARKVLELRFAGKSCDEILKLLLQDIQNIKFDSIRRHYCAVCDVTSLNLNEHEQHMVSTVHNFTKEDFKRKCIVEILQGVKPDDAGQYTCDLCKVTESNLVSFNSHLHSLTHKYKYKAEKARKFQLKQRTLMLQGRATRRWMGGGYKTVIPWLRKYEKNPGIRTKIGGTATDLATGAMAAVSNLEDLEPRIDSVKNVQIGHQGTKDPPERRKPIRKFPRKAPLLPYHPMVQRAFPLRPQFCPRPMPFQRPPFPFLPPGPRPHPRFRRLNAPPGMVGYPPPWARYSPY